MFKLMEGQNRTEYRYPPVCTGDTFPLWILKLNGNLLLLINGYLVSSSIQAAGLLVFL